MSTILRVYPTKFHENFHTSESHENYYNDVLGHNDHESGLIFIINITSNCIFIITVISNCISLYPPCLPLPVPATQPQPHHTQLLQCSECSSHADTCNDSNNDNNDDNINSSSNNNNNDRLVW